MNPKLQGDPKKQDPNLKNATYSVQHDQTPRREGGDDAIAETNPDDSRADEKVIVNNQEEDTIVNGESGNDASVNEG